MNVGEKSIRILRREGVVNLLRRAARKSLTRLQLPGLKKDHANLVSAFQRRTEQMGTDDLDHFYWYHTVDLGKGLVTPGDYDYRDLLHRFRFPENMSGMSVLDVGSATGFFAFEFERRGANVVSVELPSLDAWDIVWNRREEVLNELMRLHHAKTPEEAHYRHLDGPFRFCQEMLGSKVRRCYSTVYDLTPDKLGDDCFDLIFVGDVLLHLFAPLTALNVLAPLCRGTLVVTTDRLRTPKRSPVAYYLGHESRQAETRGWWWPSDTCLRDMLTCVGFKRVTRVGSYSGIIRRTWKQFSRDVFHAVR